MVHRIINGISIIIFSTLFISSCYYDNEEELYPGEEICNTDSLNYNSNIAQIINTNCAKSNCHGGPQSPSLTGFQNVLGNIDRIKVRAIEDRTMPPLSEQPLSECEINQLEAWINSGAPEN